MLDRDRSHKKAAVEGAGQSIEYGARLGQQCFKPCDSDLDLYLMWTEHFSHAWLPSSMLSY